MPKFTLRVYGVALAMARGAGPTGGDIGRSDSDLARQFRRALTSILLNMAEAMDADGRNRHARFRIALGSTNECIAILEVAAALGYITVDAALMDQFQHVRATLLRLVMPKR